MAEVTIMLLKVDLQCSNCYKKVKKVLCKYPEIRDQVYDEKQNTVTIKVVTCCPERLMQKICRKGGKAIKSIEIKKPEKKTEKPKVVIIDPPPKQKPQPPKASDPAPTSKAIVQAPTLQAPVLAPGYPSYPIGVSCRECYGGHGGGPCQQLGYGRPICYDGYYGRPVYDSWGGRGGGWSRSNYRSGGDYFCDENPSTCSIM
ncbi:protein PYRICULARIA ORYZAE RESISTANCE 21-like [Pistacia vera]|uniref:Uncharacterized protein n=1 Tax=Pistacia integerrima TaxID=434235 RepID=A0ACC0XKR6_9ROSI|nr:protein PYRICULARIA ORYZAE RESISTANCE 21-like [Pistacia vera]KAJ0019008.1 hypothetical protein Pint_09441 [Pistacia integerrima]